MEELLIIVFQFVFEFILNVLSGIPFDWPSKNRKIPEPESIFLQCFLWFCGGCLVAGASLLIFKNTLISVPALRVINLVLAPIVSGLVSSSIASRRALDNEFIVPRNHFWYAFWFTLGLVMIRFIYAARN